MVKSIIDDFKDLVRCYKPIKSFYCNTQAYKGSGKDIYPLLWLEMPFMANPIQGGAMFEFDINFEVLRKPTSDTNAAKIAAMEDAETDCLNIVESIKRLKLVEGTVKDYSLLSLYEHTDDKVSGYRCSMKLDVVNDAELCKLASNYDAQKTLIESANLPDFDVDDTGCVTKTKDFKLNFGTQGNDTN